MVLRPQAVLELYLGSYRPPWPKGAFINAKSISISRELPELKSTNLKACREAQRWAQEAGAQEAFLVSPQGEVLEAAWSNIFWFTATDELYTPPSGILPGITRRLILEHEKVQLGTISLDDFHKEAKEVFITRSTTGVTPVCSLDGKAIGDGTVGRLTKQLTSRYDELVESLLEPVEVA